MMSDVSLYIYFTYSSQNITKKLGTKIFEPGKMMKSLSGDMILPKFGEYNYYHETGPKPELILFQVRETIVVFKKETQLLIDFSDVDIYYINRIDIIGGGNHGQGLFLFPIKILYTMKNCKRHESK